MVLDASPQPDVVLLDQNLRSRVVPTGERRRAPRLHARSAPAGTRAPSSSAPPMSRARRWSSTARRAPTTSSRRIRPPMTFSASLASRLRPLTTRPTPSWIAVRRCGRARRRPTKSRRPSRSRCRPARRSLARAHSSASVTLRPTACTACRRAPPARSASAAPPARVASSVMLSSAASRRRTRASTLSTTCCTRPGRRLPESCTGATPRAPPPPPPRPPPPSSPPPRLPTASLRHGLRSRVITSRRRRQLVPPPHRRRVTASAPAAAPAAPRRSTRPPAARHGRCGASTAATPAADSPPAARLPRCRRAIESLSTAPAPSSFDPAAAPAFGGEQVITAAQWAIFDQDSARVVRTLLDGENHFVAALHQLRGQALVVGAPRLVRMVKALEAAGRARRPPRKCGRSKMRAAPRCRRQDSARPPVRR